MIRFVDLTAAYGITGVPQCAFLDTVTDRFLEVEDIGTHVCDDSADLEELPEAYRERCKALVPTGFWSSGG